MLEANLVGAYLQGSFALGEGDVHSDVDFVIVTTGHPTAEQQAGLQELHAGLHDLPVTWAQHLEGSYIPSTLLRHVDPARSPCFYLDNGARSLVWSDHCNTAHVRWLLREHGIVLAGPSPEQLIEPVAPDALREEAMRALEEYATWAEQSRPFNRWQQPYLVLTFCRLLWTLHHGTVTTKRDAGEWALGELDAEWNELIGQALADRADPWERFYLPSTPEADELTCAFIDYAAGYGASRRRGRSRRRGSASTRHATSPRRQPRDIAARRRARSGSLPAARGPSRTTTVRRRGAGR